MKSTEKLLAFLEHIAELEDDQLAQIVPFVSATRARVMLAGASRFLPEDPDQLDTWTIAAMQFAQAIRSDDAAPIAVTFEADGKMVTMPTFDLSELFGVPS